MKARQLEKLGIPHQLTKMVKWLVPRARAAGMSADQVRQRLERIVAEPEAHREDEYFGEVAQQLARMDLAGERRQAGWREREAPAPWKEWTGPNIELDAQSVRQLHNACRLPVALAGALMPDAHVGYGLPIGGVLATDNAVIPYAVGVDIACRMKLTVLDLEPKALESQPDRLIKAIETETRFGIGAQFRDHRREHEVMDADWNITPKIRHLKDKAHAQLGTSGSGNHFVEFGEFTVDEAQARALGLPGALPGAYLALLSHSGSRGPGATIADHYSRLAMALHPELPDELRHLAWLDLASAEGQEYWAAMSLMGEYAAANHAMIHKHIAKHLGARVILDIENHHNFAWKETHTIAGEQREAIVHRKGATPAGRNVLGIIPGSMASPCYIVRGRGNDEALQSAAHGAGRVMSRTKAKQTYRWSDARPLLEKRHVTLLSAGLDELPFVYKNIDDVMAAQSDLIDIVGRFDPRIVKMAPAGERPED